MKNQTWDLCPLLKGRKLVWCQWVYYTKYVADGSIDRYEERLVAKGFSHVEGVYYFETFAPISKMNSICLILSLTTSHGWTIF